MISGKAGFSVGSPSPENVMESMRVPSAEAVSKGQKANKATVEAFGKAVLEDIHPRDSWRAAKAFREHIAVEMAKRALIRASELGGGVIRE